MREIKPVFSSATASFWYPGLQLFTRPDGIEGVRATYVITQGSCFKYLGRTLNKKQEHVLQQRAMKAGSHSQFRTYNKYVVDVGGDATEFVDAHPRYYPYIQSTGEQVGGRGLYLAGKINEPNRNKRANLYAQTLHGIVWLIAARKIQPGEELSWNYGDQFDSARDYPVGSDVWDV